MSKQKKGMTPEKRQEQSVIWTMFLIFVVVAVMMLSFAESTVKGDYVTSETEQVQVVE